MPQSVQRIAKTFVVLPLRFIAEIAVLLFDFFLSRYFVAAIIVGVFWIPCHFLFGAELGAIYWPTLVLGTLLLGLWECCTIFTIREFLAKSGIVEPWDD